MTFENRIAEADQLKAEIDAKRPLGAHALRQLKGYYRIGLTWSSNALEGNSLTETETKIVLEDGITIGGKPVRDHLEAIGHGEAFDLLHKLAGRSEITQRDILNLHKLFYVRIDPENAGRYRKVGVVITGSSLELPRPAELKERMTEFVARLSGRRGALHPVEFAAWLHSGLAGIHPFIDGNGRAARLLMNLALMQAGYPITIIPPVLQNAYLDALKAGDRGDNRPFLNLVSNMVVESALDHLRLLRSLGEE